MGAENVEDIYELSPLQRGMLLHSAYDGAADMYLSQQTYRADGDFDPDALVRAWQATTAAHPVAGTATGLPVRGTTSPTATGARHGDSAVYAGGWAQALRSYTALARWLRINGFPRRKPSLAVWPHILSRRR